MEDKFSDHASPSPAWRPSPLQRRDSAGDTLPLTNIDEFEEQPKPRRLHSDPFTLSREEEIVVLEDVDVDVPIPAQFTSIEYPRTDDGRAEGNAVHTPGVLSLSPMDYSWLIQVEDAAEELGDEFLQKVANKTQEMSVKKSEAIFEVLTDLLVERIGSENQALLWVLRRKESELRQIHKVLLVILLGRGASTNFAGPDLNTPLHLAARHGYCDVARKLLEKGAPVMAENSEMQTPLDIAIENKHSEFAKLMIKSSEPSRIRQLFQCKGNKPSRLSLHSLLECSAMQSTVMAVLDTLMEPLIRQDGSDAFLIHYGILERDPAGRAPTDPKFDGKSKSCLRIIVKTNNKEVMCHDVVYLFVRRKWYKFARYVFLVQFVFYLMLMAFLTAALVLAAREQDPRQYDKPVDIFRGCCEAISLLAISYNGLSELKQLKIRKLHYFTDAQNYLDVPAVLFTMLIIPFRATGLSVQWLFSSLSYLFNGLRAFKYVPAFRSTGAYVQILLRVLQQDMVQFGAIFCIFLVSFSGAFYLALRGEIRVTNGTSFSNNSSDFMTSLDIYPYETAEYYNVLFTGLRVIIEGGVIVDQYFGPSGFGWLGVLIYVVFLFLVIVLLLNLLIAQMSDTYSNVQEKAQRNLVINRAQFIATRVLGDRFRKQLYKSCELVERPQDILKWEVPSNRVLKKDLKRIERRQQMHERAMDQLRTDILKQLSQQGELLSQQGELLKCLLEEQTQWRQPGRGTQ